MAKTLRKKKKEKSPLVKEDCRKEKNTEMDENVWDREKNIELEVDRKSTRVR